MRQPGIRKAGWLAAGSLWLLAVGTGTVSLWEYESTPGQPATAPRTWPSASAIARSPGRHTLLLFAHPFCACTRASLAELNVLLAHTMGHVATTVLVLKPAGATRSPARRC